MLSIHVYKAPALKSPAENGIPKKYRDMSLSIDIHIP